MSAEQEYREYLERCSRSKGIPMAEVNKERICIEVGMYYGLKESEIERMQFEE